MTTAERSRRNTERTKRTIDALKECVSAEADALLDAARELERLGSTDLAKRCRYTAQHAVRTMDADHSPEPVADDPATLDKPKSALVMVPEVGNKAASLVDLNGYDPRQAAYAAKMQEKGIEALARDAERKAKYG
jgi:hypothetical protein